MSYDSEQQNRMNRAKYESMRIVELDRIKQTAIIENSTHDSFYTVTVNSCTCPDFQKRCLPCKHIYKLRDTLGLSDKNPKTAVSPKSAKKEKQPATVVVLLDKPDISFVVIGIIILVVALFLSGSSIPAGIVVALFGLYFIYGYIAFKRKPNNPKYITEEQLEHWQRLTSSSKKTVRELQKASLPILLELKSRTENYYSQLSTAITAADIEKCSELLLNTQQKIVDFSEFVTIKGDDPQKDFEKYSSLVKELAD